MKVISWLKEGSHLRQVLEEIIEHTKWTGDNVISVDNPMTLSYGWTAGPVSWEVRVDVATHELEDSKSEEASLFLKSFSTGIGRVAIARSFPGQRKQRDCPPIFECPRCCGKTWVHGYGVSKHSQDECDDVLIRNVHDV